MIQTKTHRKYLFTPLRYPGGKTSLFDFFDKVIKRHSWEDTIYIEPYAGGAGAALSLLLLEKVNAIVINDYDPAIYAFWRSILEETDAFIEKVQSTPTTVEEWDKQKAVYKIADGNDALNLGFATFFLNRTNRSGILNAGPVGGRAQTGNWKMDARYNRHNLIEKIKLIALYKDRITVTNDDGIDVIRKYAHTPNAFFYVDPPYYVQGANLYLNSFKPENHKSLALALHNIRSKRWILTYDDVPEIRELYQTHESSNFPLKYSAHHASTASELMVFSDAIDLSLLQEDA